MHKILLVCLFSVVLSIARAQDPYSISFTEINGLSSNHVYDVFQDTKGFMWFATDRGLCRYDGFQFVNFGNNEQLSKSGSYISEDGFGRIWYMNFDGYLFYVDRGILHSLHQKEPIGCLNYGIRENELFVIEKDAIAIYDLHTLKVKRKITHHAPEDLYIYSVITKDGFLCVGRNSLMIDWKYRKTRPDFGFTDQHLVLGLTSKTGESVIFCSKFLTKNNLYSYSGKKIIPRFPFRTASSVQALCQTKQTIWACTINGVFGFSEKGKPLNNGRAYFGDKSISDVFEDKQNNLWISTTSSGILFIPNKNTLYYPMHSGAGFFFRTNNQVIMVNEKGEFRKFAGNQWVKTAQLKGFTEKVERLFYDQQSATIATSSKSFEFWDQQGNKKETLLMAVKDFQRLDDRYFLLAASGICGVYDSNPSLPSEWETEFRNYPTRPENKRFIELMIGARGKSVCLDKVSKSFYLSTNLGVFRFHNGRFSEVLSGTKRIYLNQLLRFGNRIIGLDDNGKLFELSGKQIQPLQVKRLVPAILQIDKMKVVGSSLYLVGNRNVYILDSNFESVRKLELNIGSSDFSDITESDGLIFIATNSGVLTFLKKDISRLSAHPDLEILSIKVNNRSIAGTELLKLEHDQNDIEIAYAILDYVNPNRYPLYYRMNGSSWKMASPQSRILSFAALEPGNYTIDLEMNGKLLTTIRWSIHTPWWKSLWFYCSMFLAVSCSIIYFFRSRIRRIKKRNELLTEKLMLEKSLKESMLKSVKAQMNPHFFYNALNTVQSFIFEGDKRNASTYLSKFSTLSRMILEMSEMELVTLEMECKAIRLYMDIEKARFSEDFHFIFTIDPALSQEKIRIPPMLIQPYLENAVKHGLLHKKGKKVLELTIELPEEKKLKVTITDNGIGRFKSAEINRHKHSQHTSFASDANAKRLQLLQRENDAPSIVFDDLADESGESLGTKVEIYIPFE